VDFWLIAGRLARRWYLTLPLAAAAVLLAVTVASSVRPSYSAETQLLLSPRQAPTSTANPLLLSSQQQLAAATQSLLFVLDSPASAADRRQAAPGAKVVYSLIEEAPIVIVKVTGSTRTTVQHGVEAAVDQVGGALRAVEDPLGTTIEQRIDTVQLAVPSVQQESGDQRRVLIGVALAGLLTTALLVLAMDQALRRGVERRFAADLDRDLGRLSQTGSGAQGGPRHTTR